MWARIKSVILGRSDQPAVVAEVELLSQTAVNENMAPEQNQKQILRMVPRHTPPLMIRIAAAATNLAETNIRAADQFGLGSEKVASFDERSAILRVAFSNGVTAIFPGQSLGRYSSRSGIFSWAWTNPDLDQNAKSLVDRIRFMGEEFDEALLTSESLGIPFDEVLALAAFVAHEGGMPLVYALTAEGQTLQFLALGTPTFASSQGRAISSPFLMRRTVGQAAGSFMFNNADDASLRFTVPHIDGGNIVVEISDDGHASARRFFTTPDKRVESTNMPDWGSGFLWPQG